MSESTNLKTIFHYYRFNLTNDTERQAYQELREKLEAMNVRLFNVIADHSDSRNFSDLDGKEIELETDHLFDNQWNTAPNEISDKGLRVFDWYEGIVPNRSIKSGHWLEQTSEMTAIRANTFVCGYCGKKSDKSDVFCRHCLGSEYLKETDLKLLVLRAVKDRYDVDYDAVVIPESILAEYKEKQKASRIIRLKKRQERQLEDLRTKITNAEIEYTAFELLIDNDIDFENVIYYSHTQTFCFGWREKLSDDDAGKLAKQLNDCGFTARYKTELKTVYSD
jgi:hypothetical protein